MQEITITKDATSQIIPISIYDSSSLIGAKLAGLVFNSASLTAYYNRTGAAGAATAITLVTATKGTWVSGGFVAVDATNMPGDYELHIPDAVIASGVDSVLIQIKGATNMVPLNIKVNLTAVDLQDAVDFGLSALAGNVPQSANNNTHLATLVSTLSTGLLAEPNDKNLIDQIRKILSVVELRRDSHAYQASGNIFYVDPVNGDTHANGNRGGRSDPYLGVQDCHDNAVVDSNHDMIILLSGAAAGPTTLTEAVTLTKRYLFIHGPGRDFMWTRSGNGNTISVTADGIGLSGFQLNTAATGNGHGVLLTDADFLKVTDVWVNDTQGDGVHILRGSHCLIRDNHFEGAGQGGAGQGVHISGTAGVSDENSITHNIFSDCAGDAVLVSGGTSLHTQICQNEMHGSAGWGINLTASSTGAVVCDNVLGNNASGDVLDSGVDTISLNNEAHATETKQDIALADLTKILSGKVRRNQAFSGIPFPMKTAAGVLTEGLTVAGTRSIDRSAQAPVSGAIVEIGGGWYAFSPLAADTNGDDVALTFSAPSMTSTLVPIVTTD